MWAFYKGNLKIPTGAKRSALRRFCYTTLIGPFSAVRKSWELIFGQRTVLKFYFMFLSFVVFYSTFYYPGEPTDCECILCKSTVNNRQGSFWSRTLLPRLWFAGRQCFLFRFYQVRTFLESTENITYKIYDYNYFRDTMWWVVVRIACWLSWEFFWW